MTKYVQCFGYGIVVATIGFRGSANIGDKGENKIREESGEVEK